MQPAKELVEPKIVTAGLQPCRSGTVAAGVMDAYSSPAGMSSLVWQQQYSKDPENGWVWGNHPEATPQELQQLKEVVMRNKAAFAYSMKELPGCKGVVSLGEYHGKPAYSGKKEYNPAEVEIINKKCVELRDADIIRRVPLSNAFASRPTIAAKRDAETGEWTDQRFCINFVKLNKGTVRDPYPLPLPDVMFRKFKTARFYTKLDMRSGFHQLVLDPESQLRTAFWWGNELWCYNRLPFGARNASAIFQRAMDSMLVEAKLDDNAGAFIDDSTIWTDTAKQHIVMVDLTLKACRQAGMMVHPDKSCFMAAGLGFLGHVISMFGFQPDDARLAAFRQLPIPKTKRQLLSHLGMLGFYRCYLPRYSMLSEPLRKFTKQTAPEQLQWDEATAAAYEGLVTELTSEGKGLVRARADRPFILHTDWSVKGIGAVLMQPDDEGRERMVACISRSLNIHEARYAAWKGELLAVVWAILHLRPYLAGREFTLVTDHRPLLWLMTSPVLAGQQERWVLALQEYSFTIEHRAGSQNPADLPSRYPLESSEDPSGARLDNAGSLQRILPRVQFNTEEERLEAIREFIEGTYVKQSGIAAVLAECAGDVATSGAQQAAAYSSAVQQLVQHTLPPAAALAQAVPDHADLGFPELTGVELTTTDWDHSHSLVQLNAAKWQVWAAAIVRPLQLTVGRGQTTQIALPVLRAADTGVVVLELFGGMCAGLEACLKCGWKVCRYLYVDKDPEVRKVAAYRLASLQAQYSAQLQLMALQHAFTSWPQDVREIQPVHLQELGHSPIPVLLWAGWECQDLSPAGPGRGLAGPRSSTFFPLLKIVRHLQGTLGDRFGYMVENIAMDVPWQTSRRVLEDYQTIKRALGEPVCADAARFGSYAHRLRYYWTNLAPQLSLQSATHTVERPPGRYVDDILSPGRQSQPVYWNDKRPFYPCNKVGQPRAALPTLMAVQQSYNFQPGQPGSIWETATKTWSEPNITEREVALGYAWGTTAAPGVTDLVRHQVTGRSMDANTVTALLALCQQLAVQGGGVEIIAAASTSCTPATSVTAVTCQHAITRSLNESVYVQAAAAVTVQQEATSKDIWEDPGALHYLQVGSYQPAVSRAEQSRIAHRAKLYVWQQGQLFRRLPAGPLKLVPPVADRDQLVSTIHQQAGHFGIKRTADLVAASHWWRALHSDVAKVVSRCAICDRVRCSFNSVQPQLQPLPVEPMFYRWGFDLAGEFPVSARGYKWVFIGIEHFSKHIELIPLRSKTPEETAMAATEILCRFAAPAEVVTDGGGEWEGAFSELMTQCFIDHRITSPNHPQANGLAERAVQTVKRSLRKLAETKVSTQWDKMLPWVALGYRCSRQSSTKFSPYHLLYGREPVFPSSAQLKFKECIDLDSPELAADSVLYRATVLERTMPIAAANLKAAQHRDSARYLQLRSKGYMPKVADFRPGDFVYLKRAVGSTLAVKARPIILRVKRVKPSGAVELEDRAGKTQQVTPTQLAPCHLPDIDGVIDRTLRGEDQAAPCTRCSLTDDWALFLFCDNCNRGWHTYCCSPPLAAVPEGIFLCEICRAVGVTEQHVQAAEVQRELLQQEGLPDLFPLAQKRRRDEAAAVLHGRIVKKQVKDGVWWGRVNYLGPLARPRYFKVAYANGQVEGGLTIYLITKGKHYELLAEDAQPPAGVLVPAAEEVPVH